MTDRAKENDGKSFSARLLEICATSQDPITDITELAYDHFKRPINVMDTAYNVLAQFPNETIGDTIWDSQMENHSTDTSTISQYYSDNIISKLLSVDKPIIVDWGVVSNCPRIACTLKRNGVVTGTIGLLCPGGKYKESDFQDLNLVAQALSIAQVGVYGMTNQDMLTRKTTRIQNVLLSVLFKGKIKNDQDLEKWQNNTRIKLQPGFRVIAVSPGMKSESASFLLSNLQKMLPGHLMGVFPYYEEQTLYVLLTRQSRHWEDNIGNYANITEFLDALKSYRLPYGISGYFEQLADIEQYKYQSIRTAELCDVYNLSENFHVYDNVAPINILSFCTDSLGESAYIHPALDTLRKTDDMDGTDYYRTMETYIMSLGNSKETSEKLFIHRNTLIYRLNRISEITHIDFSDTSTFLHLLISYYIKKYLS